MSRPLGPLGAAEIGGPGSGSSTSMARSARWGERDHRSRHFWVRHRKRGLL